MGNFVVKKTHPGAFKIGSLSINSTHRPSDRRDVTLLPHTLAIMADYLDLPFNSRAILTISFYILYIILVPIKGTHFVSTRIEIPGLKHRSRTGHLKGSL